MRYVIFTLCILLAAATPGHAEDDKYFSFGGDQYAAGNQPAITGPVARDAFVAGFNPQLTGTVSGDAHAAGFSVTISANVSGDVYAAGNTITLTGPVGGDATLFGNTINITGAEGITGNLRTGGASVTLSAPVSGAALVGAGSARLDAPIAGDFFFSGNTLSFGTNARISGTVKIETSADITVPESVAPASRVTITRVEPKEIAGHATGIAEETVRGFWPFWLPLIAMLIALPALGAIWLALFPRRSLIAYRVAMAKPWKSLFYGIIGIAALIGLVPVLLMTIIGIPLIPFAIAFIILVGIIGYIAGAWFVATRVMTAFGYHDDNMGKHLIALIVGVVVAMLLGWIPILGWLLQLVLAFLGLGGMALSAIARSVDAGFHAEIAKEVDDALSG